MRLCDYVLGSFGKRNSYNPVPLYAVALGLFLIMSCVAVRAESAYPLVQTDIGSTGATGAYSAGPPTFIVDGSGTGFDGAVDGFTYVSTSASGNIEIRAKVTSLAPIPPESTYSSYASCGLMVRSSTAANSPLAYVSVSPANGVNFTARTQPGTVSNTTLGPSVAAPVWLRLVVSGTTIAGYYTTDANGISNWVLAGKTTMPLPASYRVGLAVSSKIDNTLIRGQFTKLSILTSVPQRSSNMLFWLRSDLDLQYSGTAISNWKDQSGNGRDYSQPNPTNQPTLVASDPLANGLPSLSFNGSTNYLKLLSTQGTPLAGPDVTHGISIFIVAKPTTMATGKRLLDFGTASNNFVSLYENANKPFFIVNKSGSGQSLVGTSVLSTSAYQLIEVTQGPSGTSNTNQYLNGNPNGGPSNVFTWTTTNQLSNTIGTSVAGISSSYCYNGNICEVLVYSGDVDTATRQSIEKYVFDKYNFILNSAPAAPTITPSKGITSVSTVTITGTAGTKLWYTLDGLTPVVGHADTFLYTSPFNASVGSITTVKAIATVPFAPPSPVTSVTFAVDPLASGIPTDSMAIWLRSDLGVTTFGGSNVGFWQNLSGNQYQYAIGENQPQLVMNEINGLPAISFSSSNQSYMSISPLVMDFSGWTAFAVIKQDALGSGATGTLISTFEAPSNSLSVLNNSSANYALQMDFASGSWTVNANNIVPVGSVLLAEGVTQSGTGVIYLNGIQQAQGTLPIWDSSYAFIGRHPAYGNYYNGKIAEVLLWGRDLSNAERQSVEAYLMNRYGLKTPPTVTFSLPSGSALPEPTQIAIRSTPGSTIHYSRTGPATTSSPIYNEPVTVSYSQTLYALAVAPSGLQASSSATYLLDATKWQAPPATDSNNPKINIIVPAPAQ